ARRRPTVVAAGLQRGIQRGACGRGSRLTQCHDLRVALTRRLGPTFAYDLAVADDDRADGGGRAAEAPRPPRPRPRPPHVVHLTAPCCCAPKKTPKARQAFGLLSRPACLLSSGLYRRLWNRTRSARSATVGAVDAPGRPGFRGCRQHPVARRARGLCRVASPPVRNWRAPDWRAAPCPEGYASYSVAESIAPIRRLSLSLHGSGREHGPVSRVGLLRDARVREARQRPCAPALRQLATQAAVFLQSPQCVPKRPSLALGHDDPRVAQQVRYLAA